MSKTIAAVQSNRGIEAAYKKALKALLDEMEKSYSWWLEAEYKKAPPLISELAADALPISAMRKKLEQLGEQWHWRFESSAEKIAELYAKRSYRYSDNALKKALKDAGWSVEFKMTRAMRESLDAVISENVSLIQSIPMQFHQKIEGAVMRSYSIGGDLQQLTKELRQIYSGTEARISLIARDQISKANSVATRARQMELGITEAVWIHSHAGKEPRKSHEAAHGEIYKIAEGCKIDGEYIQPAEKINCRCMARPILPF
jgi:SPP1 gp7 family putative phage head morphogenesis protein